MAAKDIQSLLKSAADQLKQQQQLKNTSDADDEKLCSFPVKSHPKQAAMEEHRRAWMQEFFGSSASAQQLQKLLDSRFDTLSCLLYPYGTSESRSFTLFKFILWVFLVDDVLDDSSVLGQTHAPARLFCSRQIKAMFGSPYEAAQAAGLDDVCTEDDHLTPSELSAMDKRIQTEQQLVIKLGAEWTAEMRAQGMSPKQYKRLQEAVVENLGGILEVVALREQGKLPASVVEYVALHRRDGAYKVGFIGCEFDLGIELDDQALSHPSLEALHDATSDQAGWINDLFSFHKEYHEGNFINLPALLHYLNNSNSPTDIDFHQSLSEVRAMIQAKDQDCVRLSREVEEWNPALRPYVQATHCTISGLLAWTLTSLRYKVASDSTSEPTLA